MFVTSALALYVYDRILTFGSEIDMIWRRKKIGIAIPVLYTSMHMLVLLYLLLYVCPPTVISLQSLWAMDVMSDISVCLLYLTWGFIAAMRVYAVNGRGSSIYAPAFVFLWWLIPVGINIVRSLFVTRVLSDRAD
ncbi:uncharacterized protein B0H18DRAFT_1003427 [Fomitopsis serialis]|uniref:uncharacterized protein n=1 Tax=Fomitopsis serialis TaxID=139415 RepID=UPI002007D2CF|nr:uncharacterized protein B0H18DRAFT_1003427 [Neoantrodia serialis]KAH9927702.1 hypothetical protein B0H18DRAFT_1003427 [Neoantrodia serialis]